MANNRVSPNRMSLMRLKRELRTAARGHSMLKDKRDGLMKEFLAMVDGTLALRQEVDRLLADAALAMSMARAVMQPEMLDEAMLLSAEALCFEVSRKSVMAVDYPAFDSGAASGMGSGSGRFTYGLASTSGELDLALDALRRALPTMVELAEKEKQLQLMANEIEKTRRRVNSLEHVMIPKLKAQIKDISMRMEENERDGLTRLMKVKDMIVAEEIQARRRRAEIAEAEFKAKQAAAEA
ncbi:MAG: V-type ATP synthase subunit D [Eubacteriales bacterium]|nr:V-type ATP synthase subunit D [Eubacteriales bacterium]